MDKVKHTGGCHCGAVRFEVWAPKVLDTIICKSVKILFHDRRTHVFTSVAVFVSKSKTPIS